jgi:hypothetical protein
MRIFKIIIVGSGFSAHILSKILKKKNYIITTDSKYINFLPKRKNLTKHLKLFAKKYNSHGTYKYILKKSILHDTLLHGGNTNFWGGICNVSKILKYSDLFKHNFFFKKISRKDTGSFSTNKHLFQMQLIGSNNGNIFNCSDYFANLIRGHLVSFNIVKKDLICLKIKNAKIKNYFCKKLILAVNATQLIDILINSNIVKNRDEISLTEHKFNTKITLFNNIKKNKKIYLILSYSLSGIIKHALGIQKNFSRSLFRFFNLFPIFYHQIFYKKKIMATYRVEKEKLIINEISEKTDNGFGKSIHYFNMKINNINLEKILKKISKNIYGISSPFIINKFPGPISNNLIEKVFEVSKKLSK